MTDCHCTYFVCYMYNSAILGVNYFICWFYITIYTSITHYLYLFLCIDILKKCKLFCGWIVFKVDNFLYFSVGHFALLGFYVKNPVKYQKITHNTRYLLWSTENYPQYQKITIKYWKYQKITHNIVYTKNDTRKLPLSMVNTRKLPENTVNTIKVQ